jgi:hypothetical protein
MRYKLIKQVVRDINPNIKIKFYKGNNESDIINQKVYLNFSKGWLDDEMITHLNEVNKTYRFQDLVSPEVFITLHEIGHIESVAHYNTQSVSFLLSKYVKQIEKIDDNLPYNLQARRYTKLKLERKANSWALNYIKANPEMVAKLEKAFR